MSTTTQPSNASTPRVRGVRTLLLGLLIVNIVGFSAIVWMIETQLSDLRLEVGVLRALNDGRFAIDQRTYSTGQGRVYYQMDTFKSVGDLVRHYEQGMLNIHVPPGTYGKNWYLVDANTNAPIEYSIERDLDPSILDAGIKPGMLLSVVQKPKG